MTNTSTFAKLLTISTAFVISSTLFAAGDTGTGLRGEYYNSLDLTGPLAMSRTDTTVNFTWPNTSPGFGVHPNRYSIRWTGTVKAPVSGAFVFTTVSDDGVRLWVNGAEVINNWTLHSAIENHSAAITLTAEKSYDVRLEFYQNYGAAVAKLEWEYPNQARQVIPQARLSPPATIFLSDLTPVSAKNGSGPVEIDQSNGGPAANDGHKLTINGVVYAKGLGVSAPSEVIYTLGGQYTTFNASIGIDDEIDSKHGSAVFQVWLDGVKAYESDEVTGAMAATYIHVDVFGKQQLRLVVSDAGGGSSDHADWADAQLSKAQADPYLSDLPWTSAVSGWGPVERDRSNGEQAAFDGHPLSIGGIKYAKGLGLHSTSDVRYSLAGKYREFIAYVGVDDEVGARGSVVFEVWADGKKLFESPVMKGGEKAAQVQVDVTGMQALKLIVTDAGDGNAYDHADWASAQLIRTTSIKPPAPPPVPGAPKSLTALPGDKQITLSWMAAAGAVSYNVFRGPSSGAEAVTPVAMGITTLVFTDTGLIDGNNYYYTVAGVNPSGVGAKSNEAFTVPVAPPAPGPAPPPSAAFRFLRQSSWGPNATTLAHAQTVGLQAFLDEQFAAAPSDYPDALKSQSLEMSQERFFRNGLLGDDQLRQRVGFALSQILVASGVKVDNAAAMVPYIKLLQARAFDNFYNVMRDVTLNPAMGEFLDMVNNKKGNAADGTSPNENYARELMQLFSLGTVNLNVDGTPGVGAPYDQKTVSELARVFTGWTYGDNKSVQPTNQNPPFYDGPMKPVEKFHDTGAKMLFGTQLNPGQTTTQDLDQALTLIFNHPNVGPFICKQLIEHLVTSNPSPKYVTDVATVFNNNGSGVRGDLKAVVKAILFHPEAALGTATAGKLDEPAIFLLAQLRALNATVVDHPFISDKSEEMGERIWYAPSVFSYFSPGYRIAGSGLTGPEFQIYNTATALIRTNFVATLLSGGFGSDVKVDLKPYSALAANPGALVDQVSAVLLGGSMSAQMKQSILDAIKVAPNATEKAQTALYLTLTALQFQVEH